MIKKKKKKEKEQKVIQVTPPARDMPKQVEPNQNNGPAWLISFTDVMALMLTFFVLLFSMSNPKKDAWTDVITALDSEFNKYFSAKHTSGAVDAEDIDRLTKERTLSLNYLEALLNRLTSEYEMLSDLTITKDKNRIVLSLPGSLLFNSGDAGISEQGRQILFNVGNVLGNIMNEIEVHGFTDSDPVTHGAYASNWDLSLARAVNVATFLDEAGYSRGIVTRGFADGQYDDIDQSLPEDMRKQKARRVDIIISGS